MKVKAWRLKEALKNKANDITSKMSGDDKLVVALVLIAVAVGLCIIFRNSISNIMKNIFGTMENKINSLFNETVS